MRLKHLEKKELGKLRSDFLKIRRKNIVDFVSKNEEKYNNGFKMTFFSSKEINAFYLIAFLKNPYPNSKDLSKIIDDKPTIDTGKLIIKVKKDNTSRYYTITTKTCYQTSLSLVSKALYFKKDMKPRTLMDLISKSIAESDRVDIIVLPEFESKNNLYFWIGQNNKVDKFFLSPEQRIEVINSPEYDRGLLLAGGITPWISKNLIIKGIKPAGYSKGQIKTLYGKDVEVAKDDISELIEDLKTKFLEEQESLMNKIL